MTKGFSSLLQVIVTIVALCSFAAANAETVAPKDPQMAWQQVVNGAVLIDVRTTEEFQQGHLAGAINIPYELIVAGVQHHQLGPDTDIVVYCRSGRRSGIAEQQLNQAGYSKVYNGGGFISLLESPHNPHQ
ncbi:rhodanese-like domain-containing protein [Neiella sp. HB171785]|uniref:Rhodanese-like domain-containing protein n=1 Tax=Neiella litorisoli TaxID=2771431 RepID=A0A8J6QQP8_9GAMM|nr:rhodanese-like domain-containing protein [Neiella litorisoli]MBD1388924.1 rhodanese-like domain-containing protein [Neiella litorisoli]